MTLTEREKQILELMCLDYEGKRIADILCVEHCTIRNAKSKIYDKLGVHTAGGAVYKYLIGEACEC